MSWHKKKIDFKAIFNRAKVKVDRVLTFINEAYNKYYEIRFGKPETKSKKLEEPVYSNRPIVPVREERTYPTKPNNMATGMNLLGPRGESGNRRTEYHNLYVSGSYLSCPISGMITSPENLDESKITLQF